MKQVLLYLPVIQAGYEAFLQRHQDAAAILLLGTGFRACFPSLDKDIRALAPERAAQYLRVTAGPAAVEVVEPDDLPAALTGDVLVLPDEQIMRDLAGRYRLAAGRTVIFDRTFLRWDRAWSTQEQPVSFDGQVTIEELPRAMLGQAARLAGQSSDWWRQVGAVAARDGAILGTAWNRHHPSEYSPYLDGDPRDGFERGVRADLSTAIHAEAAVVAQAARLIAESGLRRCFFSRTYSVLAGDQVLRAAGVELIWVDIGGASPLAPPAGS